MSAQDGDASWRAYYERIRGRAPRELLLTALTHMPAQPARFAIDLGCGDGTESVYLLQQGWHVLAIDQEPEALALLNSKILPADRERLQTQQARFETLTLPAADLIYAGLSLPFCAPESFPQVWKQIEQALSLAGWFAGHFFGERDDWMGRPDMTFFTRDRCTALLHRFDLVHFQELERDGVTGSGPHHFHAFEVIGRLRSPTGG